MPRVQVAHPLRPVPSATVGGTRRLEDLLVKSLHEAVMGVGLGYENADSRDPALSANDKTPSRVIHF